tara:strand:+ start:16961 stop:18373 length:1413 start_codon:yes stop_codon:yes gene_type:complete
LLLPKVQQPKTHKVKGPFLKFNKLPLEAPILKGIQDLGFLYPTPIQEQAIPPVLDQRDLLGLAETGTGKTAAFLIPVLQCIRDSKNKHVNGLVLVPTRELAQQVYEDAQALNKYCNLRIVSIYGGVGKSLQTKQLNRGVDVIIGCPGRVLDHIRDTTLKLDHLQFLILDEADTMCDMGFLPDVTRIIQETPSKRQTLLFSATMPDPIRNLTKKILHDPVTIQLGNLSSATTVSHTMYPVPSGLKKELLFHILSKTPTGKAVIFTRTKYKAKQLARDLSNLDYNVTSLQGNLSQSQRTNAMNGFRKGKYDLLVATDIAAHGIDVSEVTHVLNYDFPSTPDDYTHRVGRTGRAKQNGQAFSLVTPEDKHSFIMTQNKLNIEIISEFFDDFDYGIFNPIDFMKLPKKDGTNDNITRRNNSRTRRPKINVKYRKGFSHRKKHKSKTTEDFHQTKNKAPSYTKRNRTRSNKQVRT